MRYNAFQRSFEGALNLLLGRITEQRQVKAGAAAHRAGVDHRVAQFNSQKTGQKMLDGVQRSGGYFRFVRLHEAQVVFADHVSSWSLLDAGKAYVRCPDAGVIQIK